MELESKVTSSPFTLKVTVISLTPITKWPVAKKMPLKYDRHIVILLHIQNNEMHWNDKFIHPNQYIFNHSFWLHQQFISKLDGNLCWLYILVNSRRNFHTCRLLSFLILALHVASFLWHSFISFLGPLFINNPLLYLLGLDGKTLLFSFISRPLFTLKNYIVSHLHHLY